MIIAGTDQSLLGVTEHLLPKHRDELEVYYQVPSHALRTGQPTMAVCKQGRIIALASSSRAAADLNQSG